LISNQLRVHLEHCCHFRLCRLQVNISLKIMSLVKTTPRRTSTRQPSKSNLVSSADSDVVGLEHLDQKLKPSKGTPD
jgi:hypothetical protein